jgi:hypothetical protein
MAGCALQAARRRTDVGALMVVARQVPDAQRQRHRQHDKRDKHLRRAAAAGRRHHRGRENAVASHTHA